MEKIILLIINIIICIGMQYIFFGLTAKIYGIINKHDCNKCNNWACTHNGPYQEQPYYPVRDWSKWCLKEKKE